MIKIILYLGVALALLVILIDASQSIDFRSLADQSSYRCSGGVVAIGVLRYSIFKG